MASDDEAEQLAAIGIELVSRVREFGPTDNARWLHSQLPMPGQWFQLAFLLAALVPDGLTVGQLTAWTRNEDTP